MNNSIRDPKQMFELFFEYFGSGISTEAIILTIYVLFLAVFLKYSFKGIIISVIGITVAYTIYLLVYDITYVQYLISLKLDESLRLLLTQYFPHFSIAKHAPSKAMPRLDFSQASILKIKLNSSFIMNAYYEYSSKLKIKLMEYGRAYAIILTIETTRQVVKSKNTKVLTKELLFKNLIKK